FEPALSTPCTNSTGRRSNVDALATDADASRSAAAASGPMLRRIARRSVRRDPGADRSSNLISLSFRRLRVGARTKTAPCGTYQNIRRRCSKTEATALAGQSADRAAAESLLAAANRVDNRAGCGCDRFNDARHRAFDHLRRAS